MDAIEVQLISACMVSILYMRTIFEIGSYSSACTISVMLTLVFVDEKVDEVMEPVIDDVVAIEGGSMLGHVNGLSWVTSGSDIARL